MNNRQSVAARFSASAHTYDTYADVHHIAAAKVVDLVGDRGRSKHILEIGCGTGILTEKLKRALPDVSITAIDIAEAMIAVALKKMASISGIQFHQQSIDTLSNTSTFDLIISSSSLHWMTPYKRTFSKVNSLLKPKGRFVFSLMKEGTLKELHNSRLAVAPDKPVQAPLPKPSAIREALKDNDFDISKEFEQEVMVTFPSTRKLIEALNKQGVTGGTFSHSDSLLSRSELKKLCDHYDNTYKSSSGEVFATYALMYICAQKRT